MNRPYLKTLRAHGLTGKSLYDVTQATLIAKIMYAAPAWWGFLSAAEKDRIESVVKKAKRYGYLPSTFEHVHSLMESMESNLFRNILSRFTKRLLCCYGLQYSERLTKLGVDSLELRRLRFDLISVYKILFGMIETDVSVLFVVNNDTVTHGHNLKLFVQQSRIDVRKYFFCNRVIQCWNSLPATPNDFASLECFRRMLQRTDLGKFKVGRT